MLTETRLCASQLVLPLFVKTGRKQRIPVASMPGVHQLSVDEALHDATLAWSVGIRSVILFGIPSHKNKHGSGAYAKTGIVQQAVRALRRALPDLVIITDVCLCEYTDHGHCGMLSKGRRAVDVSNDSTLPLLAKTALSYAEAGADVIAPSDMMDGRVGRIRKALDEGGHEEIPILSYAAKFASAFYGPFREAAESAPRVGDRKSYQMNPANSDEAMREVAMDIQEGADMILVKPALAYLDILYRVKTTFRYPTVAYSVSGEYAMIKAAAANGWADERRLTLETLVAMRRAGADWIITYSAVEAAGWLNDAAY